MVLYYSSICFFSKKKFSLHFTYIYFNTNCNVLTNYDYEWYIQFPPYRVHICENGWPVCISQLYNCLSVSHSCMNARQSTLWPSDWMKKQENGIREIFITNDPRLLNYWTDTLLYQVRRPNWICLDSESMTP